MKEGLVIPLSQAIAAGLFIALAGWGFAAELWFVALFGTTALAAWLIQIRWWYRYQYPVEQQPQVVAQQYNQTLQLNLTINQEAAYFSGKFLELTGITPEEFIAWCTGIHAGISLGENYWTGKHNLFSKSTYTRFRTVMLHNEFVRAAGRHHAQGFELTDLGSALIDHVARRSNSPNYAIPAGYLDLFTRPVRARESERARIDGG